MSNTVLKFFTKTAGQAAKSLLLSEVKGTAKALISRARARTPQDIEQEIRMTLGYHTHHYTLNKEQKIVYKPSAVFFQEWVANSPLTAGKLIKNEEDGQIFWDGEPINNAKKVELINQFSKLTGIKTAGLASYLEGAFKLLDIKDHTSIKFKNHFAGWNPANPSIIDTWLVNCYGEALATEQIYANKLFKKWIVGVARRAISPGSSFDGCLCLQGETGVGKTQFFRQLLPSPFNTRTGEIYCNIKQPQKFVEATIGKTISNFDELSVLEHPKVMETFKQLLSSQFIDVRLPWRRDPQRFNLRTGFGSTTNKQRFIPDPFLSRRLWIISLNNRRKLNFDYLLANRENLWREAVYLAQTNEPCFLNQQDQAEVEEHNRAYYIQ